MRRVSLKHIPLEPSRLPKWIMLFYRLFFGLMVASALVVGLRWAHVLGWHSTARWPEGVFLVCAAGATLASLGRDLPAQNVILAFVVIVMLASGIWTVGAAAGVPFGPISFTDRIGQELFHPLPWPIPLLWLVLILNARGTARLILRPWRHSPIYGYWILGIATALIMAFDVGFEPIATHIFHYWNWRESKTSVTWFGTPWTNFAGWIVTTLLLLAFALPALINKKPGTHPIAWHPLIAWSLFHVLVAISAFSDGLPSLGYYLVSLAVIVSIIAVAGRNLEYRKVALLVKKEHQIEHKSAENLY